jgi:hypothetical protein
MQRRVPEGVQFLCDFCGTFWDEVIPMIEGHKGSIVCLDCLARAAEQAAPADQPFTCTMCLRPQEPGTKRYRPRPEDRSIDANPAASMCWDCIEQADRAFDRDPDIPWTRKTPPSDRWS